MFKINKQRLIQIAVATVMPTFLVASSVFAITTLGLNISTDGTLTVSSSSSLNNNVTVTVTAITSTTSITSAALDIASSATGTLDASQTRTVYGVRSQPASTAATSQATATLNLYGSYLFPSSTLATDGTTNVYGEYISTIATHAADAGTVNSYGLYIANGTSSTNGTSTKYGLYVEAPTGADTNYAAVFAGGNIGIGTATPANGLELGANMDLTLNGRTAFASVPKAGEITFRTDTQEIYTYLNDRWQADRRTPGKVVAASNSSNPYQADYMATGTNDDVTIQAAIDVMAAGSGGHVTLLEGDYYISSSIVLKTNISISGQGKNTTIHVVNNKDINVLSTTAIAYNVQLRDFVIDGNKANASGSTNGNAIYAFLDHSIIYGIQFKNIKSTAMRLCPVALDAVNLCYLNYIVQNEVQDADQNGIWWDYPFTDGWIIENNIGAANDNLKIEGSSGRVIGNHLDGAPINNVEIAAGAYNWHFWNNIFEHASQYGFYFKNASFNVGTENYAIDIGNNDFRGCSQQTNNTYDCIHIEGQSSSIKARGFAISGNIFEASDANKPQYFVNLINADSITVTGNNFATGTGGDPINISTVTNFYAEGNTNTANTIISNNVGIGTTSPTYSLSDVASISTVDRAVAAITNNNTTDSSNTVTLRLNTGATSTTTNARFVTFYSGVTSGDTGGTAVGHINLNNAAVNYATSGADYAEEFTVTDNVNPGDVIGFSKDGKNHKATITDSLLGVVSDTAGFTGASKETITRGEIRAVVGLMGQVKTNVSTENGMINIGDYLTSSSIPGVAMKANKPGVAIGRALENFDCSMVTLLHSSTKDNEHNKTIKQCNNESIGKILVFVNVGFADPQEVLSLNSNGNLANASSFSNSSVLTLTTQALQASLQKLGISIKNGILDASKVRAKELCAGDTCINEQQLKELLQK